jgi:SnoaL-like domain
MSTTLNQLMERNLLEVFGERDSARRKIAINAIYAENCTFFEMNEEIVGRDALNAKVESLLKGAPGFVFRAVSPVEVNHDVGRLRWHFGPPEAPPAVTGMDIALFQKGRIRSLYTFLEQTSA